LTFLNLQGLRAHLRPYGEVTIEES